MSEIVFTISENDKELSYTLSKDLKPFQAIILIGTLNMAIRELQDSVIEKTKLREAKI